MFFPLVAPNDLFPTARVLSASPSWFHTLLKNPLQFGFPRSTAQELELSLVSAAQVRTVYRQGVFLWAQKGWEPDYVARITSFIFSKKWCQWVMQKPGQTNLTLQIILRGISSVLMLCSNNLNPALLLDNSMGHRDRQALHQRIPGWAAPANQELRAWSGRGKPLSPPRLALAGRLATHGITPVEK